MSPRLTEDALVMALCGSDVQAVDFTVYMAIQLLACGSL